MVSEVVHCSQTSGGIPAAVVLNAWVLNTDWEWRGYRNRIWKTCDDALGVGERRRLALGNN